ncbi:putative manganese transporter [Plantactinospora sp. KLBMP9567]|uniref:putative manganese transporter n=1 Tax=Plantactinospora sp. KLBMP9567 TaxID=3085900 RepID=UPI002982811F|nr:putative manganese transporter [Plantactinospora sp. KLBMP9567]MDW5324179.1 putative manganese transporter [Plantactinospora sp. KLBMP9567]
MIELFARPLADAFMQVGVYVAVMVALFGWLRWRYGDRVTDHLTRRPRLGPLVGALLGVSPGCGGAIILMPLYARGKVSFGTVVAALAATMGDSSWVVIAADPVVALKIHALLFAVGLATGYTVDLLGVDPANAVRPRTGRWTRRVTAARASEAGLPAGAVRPYPAARAGADDRAGAAGTCPASVTVAVALAPGAVPGRPVRMSLVFWGLTMPAFLVSVPVVFHAVDPQRLSGALGGIDPYLALGCCGTLVALLIFAAGRGRFADDTVATATPASRRDAMRHSAHEASFITVWVAAAYLGWQVLSTTTGFDGSQLAFAGMVGVLVGALIGLIPGCAVQIVFTGIFVSGGLPVTTLVANAISQDGDALIPLAALRRRAAATATVITTIPAILVGLALLALLG